MPLLVTLEPQERVALVAHELAHARNGDSSRGLFVGSAIRGLAQWHVVLSPHRRSGVYQAMSTPIGLAEHVANAFLWVLSRPPLLLLYLEVGLLLQDSRRAEYLADSLAARVSCTDAVVAVHEKLLLGSAFEQVVRQHAHPAAGTGGIDVFDAPAPFWTPSRSENASAAGVSRCSRARVSAPPTPRRAGASACSSSVPSTPRRSCSRASSPRRSTASSAACVRRWHAA